ncbi:Solute carrier family 25 member 46-A, partial [Geodia barretti]
MASGGSSSTVVGGGGGREWQGDTSALTSLTKSRSFSHGVETDMGIAPSQRPMHLFPPPPAQLSAITPVTGGERHRMDIALRLTERIESWFVSVIAPFSSIVILHNIARSQVRFPYRRTPVPETLGTVIDYQSVQGLQAWWRGWYSHIFLMVSQRFSLTVLDRVLSPPRVSGSWWSRAGSFLSHYSFRGLAYLSTYPLLSFNILEMVQNLPHKVYSGGLLEVIKDRPLIAVDSHHRLPYLYLAAPIILRGFATEIVFLYCQTLVSRIVRRPADPSDTLAVVMHGLWVAYFGSFLSETVLYPLETVVARMTCQGMPVLVDNVQTGLD